MSTMRIRNRVQLGLLIGLSCVALVTGGCATESQKLLSALQERPLDEGQIDALLEGDVDVTESTDDGMSLLDVAFDAGIDTGYWTAALELSLLGASSASGAGPIVLHSEDPEGFPLIEYLQRGGDPNEYDSEGFHVLASLRRSTDVQAMINAGASTGDAGTVVWSLLGGVNTRVIEQLASEGLLNGSAARPSEPDDRYLTSDAAAQAGRPGLASRFYAIERAASASVTASSELADANDPDRYAAGAAFDGLVSTAWVEGVNGDGIGESLLVVFDDPIYIDAIRVLPGYFDERFHRANNRVAVLSVDVLLGGAAKSYVFDYTDQMTSQVHHFGEGFRAEGIRLAIDGVYPGSRWQDTPIAEVELLNDGSTIPLTSQLGDGIWVTGVDLELGGEAIPEVSSVLTNVEQGRSTAPGTLVLEGVPAGQVRSAHVVTSAPRYNQYDHASASVTTWLPETGGVIGSAAFLGDKIAFSVPGQPILLFDSDSQEPVVTDVLAYDASPLILSDGRSLAAAAPPDVELPEGEIPPTIQRWFRAGPDGLDLIADGPPVGVERGEARRWMLAGETLEEGTVHYDHRLGDMGVAPGLGIRFLDWEPGRSATSARAEIEDGRLLGVRDGAAYIAIGAELHQVPLAGLDQFTDEFAALDRSGVPTGNYGAAAGPAGQVTSFTAYAGALDARAFLMVDGLWGNQMRLGAIGRDSRFDEVAPVFYSSRQDREEGVVDDPLLPVARGLALLTTSKSHRLVWLDPPFQGGPLTVGSWPRDRSASIATDGESFALVDAVSVNLFEPYLGAVEVGERDGALALSLPSGLPVGHYSLVLDLGMTHPVVIDRVFSLVGNTGK